MSILTWIKDRFKSETRAESQALGAWSGWSDIVTGDGMTESKALSFSAIYRCCALISDTVGKLPLVVYRRVDEGKEADMSHRLYNILKYEWNEQQTAMVGLGLTIYRRLLWGNGYALIVRDAGMRPTALVPLSTETTPVMVYPSREDMETLTDGVLLYVVYDTNGRQYHLRPHEVLHIRATVGDNVAGYSLLDVAAGSWNAAVGAQEYSENFFINDASPGIVIQYPERLDPDAIKNLRAGWSNAHQGVSKSHMPAVLEAGATIDRMQPNAKDMQLIETKKWSIIDVANYFGVPPHKVGDASRTAYNSLEEENRSFLMDTIDAHLVAFELEARKKLLSEAEKDTNSHSIKFSRDELVQADLATRTDAYVKATGGRAWMAPDEVRKAENKNTVGGAQSEILDPTNNFAPQEPGDATEAEEEESDAIRAAQANLEYVKARMVKRVTKDYLRKGHIAESHRAVIEEELRHPAQLVELLTGKTDITGTTIDEIITELKEVK